MLEPPQTWYHGGVPGLEPGDLILPPSVTRVLNKTDYGPDVYLTANPVYARGYAAAWSVCPLLEGDGWVYLVGPWRPRRLGYGGHPRFAALDEASCPQATVLEVAARGVARQEWRDLGWPLADWLSYVEHRWSVYGAMGVRVPVRQRASPVRAHDGPLPAGAAGRVIVHSGTGSP